ncbi:SAM-dependent methyltransferase, partial [Pseudomonas aeruginosa]|nr:SAM-dependent methyltransferase [Pseudomonas aeruginosa]
ERLAQRARGWDWEYQELDPDVFAEELESPAYREAERIAVVGLRISRRA